MKPQFFAAINQICDEKNISYEKVLETIKAALATAYRKDYGNKEQEVDIILNEDSDIPTVLLIKEVVEEIENPNIEISLGEARKFKKDAEVGDEIRIDVTPLEYGRIAAQAAKQVILQRLHEAERESLYDMFKNRENEILSGQVVRVEGSNIHLKVEKHNVLFPQKEQIPGEKYYTGKRVKVYLDKVVATNKGPQLSISRTHPNLVIRLLEMEIPEIAEGEVEIRAIARDAGVRSKVAVWAENDKIDPIGACIGQKGVRIQKVMEELNGERVDIIEWSEDPCEFIATALQPAKIAEVIIVNQGDNPRVKKRAAVFVEESERPMAIGKKGQNVRLASDLTGFELDLYNLEQLPAFKEKLQEMMGKDHRIEDKELAGEQQTGVEAAIAAAEKATEAQITGVTESQGSAATASSQISTNKEDSQQPPWGSLTPAIIKKLLAAGFKSLSDLKGFDTKKIEAIEGIGKISAEKILKELTAA